MRNLNLKQPLAIFHLARKIKFLKFNYIRYTDFGINDYQINHSFTFSYILVRNSFGFQLAE